MMQQTKKEESNKMLYLFLSLLQMFSQRIESIVHGICVLVCGSSVRGDAKRKRLRKGLISDAQTLGNNGSK